MKLKKFRKWLRKEAEKLPPEGYEVTHKLFKPIVVKAEAGEEGDFEKMNEEGEIQKLKVVNAYQLTHNVNHYRRMKRGFNRHGFKFIQDYFTKRNFKQETNA